MVRILKQASPHSDAVSAGSELTSVEMWEPASCFFARSALISKEHKRLKPDPVDRW
jgi:hypothetical protein